MEVVKMPETKEELEKVRQYIIELMGNPYCDQFMFLSLICKLENVDKKLNQL